MIEGMLKSWYRTGNYDVIRDFISSILAVISVLVILVGTYISLSVVCEVIKHMMYKIDIANIYLGILLHYLLVLAAVLIFGYAFNWVNQLPVYVLAGMCVVVLILCCYLDISRVKADIDEINGLCENRL